MRLDILSSNLWSSAVHRCKDGLEPDDLCQVENCPNPQELRNALWLLQQDFDEQQSLLILSITHHPIIDLERICVSLTDGEGNALDSSVVWGMVLLLIKISTEADDRMPRVSKILRDLGFKLELFNGYMTEDTAIPQLREGVTDIMIYTLEFLQKIVKVFRDPLFNSLTDDNWLPIVALYKDLVQEIDSSSQRIVQLAQILKRNNENDELKRLQDLLSTDSSSSTHARLPCMVLPTFKATQIFDRNNLVEEIDRLLHRPDADPHQPQSIALHGLGGVGKSYVALKYAQSKRPELDAILWIYSETPTAIAASFTDIALRLELSGANPEHSEKNRVLVLSWLQSTTAKWLLVFDNAESPDVLLRYWPPACSGLILITTRNHNLAFEPAGGGLEVPHFDSQSGSDLILHLLRLNISQDLAEAESSSAVQLSERLSGHALALSTMAGLIHRRQWTIQEFLKVYDRDKERIHLRSLDAIWHLSFESLSPEAFRLLGILSFLMPDSIQYDLLYREDMVDLPSLISFCTDDDELWTAISRLLELALIKRERGTGSLSIHRLVQTQFLFFMDVSQRQAAFSHAATLLNIAFPNKSRSSHQMYDTWSVCRKYLQHVLSLIRAYSNEQGLASPLRPTREFCELLVRCGRYLGEIGMYSEMQDLLDVALGAYHAWEQRDEFPLVLADLERHLSVLWLQRGDFRKSEDHMIRALEIVEKDAATNIAVVLAPYNHMSNVVASAGRYDEAIMWQEKVLALSDKIEDDSMKRVALLNCNLGRALFLAGRVEEGKSRLELARDQFTGSQNWAMLAFTLFSLGNLYYFCESDVDRAEKLYTEAYDVWLKEGQAPTNEFVVSCLYRLGCCSLEHEDFTEAITCLKKAHTIASTRKLYLPGDDIRVKAKLAQALCQVPTSSLEGKLMQIDVDKELKILCQKLGLGPPPAEPDFDCFVCILWR